MTAGCARCGECCTRIWLTEDPRPWSTSALEGVPDPGTEDGWAYWLEYGWKRERDEALSRYNPDGNLRRNADFVAAYFAETCDGYWTCDAYDPEHGECTAHDDRPPLCRRYPWYGEEPSADRAGHMQKQCSYLADLPRDQRPENARPLIPLTAISR
jgi:Fe-S-cluster containining protein